MPETQVTIPTGIQRPVPADAKPSASQSASSRGDAPPPARHRNRRFAAATADFDPWRRWLIVAVSGLFGLSLVMMGLVAVDSPRTDGLRPGVAEVAPQPAPPPVLSRRPSSAAPTRPPAGAERTTAGGGDVAKQPAEIGMEYARKVAELMPRYMPRTSR